MTTNPSEGIVGNCLRSLRARASWLLPLLFALPVVVQAQFNLTTNLDGTLTITGYTGPGGSVTIPATIEGRSVTSIGFGAFQFWTGLTDVTIPSSVTSIGVIAFYDCTNLTKVVIGGGLTNLQDLSFRLCPSLAAVYFQGNAPSFVGLDVFQGDYNATAYYLPGTTGWIQFPGIAGVPAVLWNPSIQTTDGSFGVLSNRFGFNITGTANIPIAVEASSSLASGTWTALQSGTLTNGSVYFSDAQWKSYPARVYRIGPR